jgi:hypothetical protein
MSLTIPSELLEQAQRDRLDDATLETAFVESIRQSLPYAFGIVETLAEQLTRGEADWLDHAVPPPSEQERAQLLRMVGGDAIRGAVERYFGIKLAFQNCHRTAAFRPEAVDSPDYREFTSIRSQILNQTPDLVDC